MADTHLEAQAREGTGKGVTRKLRAAGKIPAVLYGGGRPAFPLILDPVALQKLLHGSEMGMNTLIDLKVTGHAELDGKTVLVRELQRDPLRGSFVHADLYEVDLSQMIEVEVPIHVSGKSKGVEFSGGILDHALRELEVRCLPRAIPDEFNLDVSALDIGDSLHVRDIVLPEGVELVSDPDLSVISCVLPAKEEEPVVEVAEGEEGAEAAADAAGEAAEGESKEGDAKREGDSKESGD